MDVNQVKFGNYSIGNSKMGAKEERKEKRAESQQTANNEALKQISADEVYQALDVQGLQNRAQIGLAQRKEVNPSDYLSEERISDIEAMMKEFEGGVEAHANAIDAEFPGLFKEDAKLALAAQMFAKE